MKLALWPLPICLLPDGFAQLRILEPKYQRMLAQAQQAQHGFAMVLAVDNQLSKIATEVKVVDVNRHSDGLVSVIIQGVRRVLINKISIESDGLKRADVRPLANWPSQNICVYDHLIARYFQQAINKYPYHKRQYQLHNFRDISWLCQRWLEVLPMPYQELLACISHQDHSLALSMLRKHFNLQLRALA